MYGAMIGDLVGSRFEFRHHKSKVFSLFTEDCCFTDDTVLTVAVARAVLCYHKGADFESALTEALVQAVQNYPNAGYGRKFLAWAKRPPHRPYGSLGNGSAMRVSPCALYAATLDEALELAERSAAVTHNHPEGIHGAQAVAAAIFLARTGWDKAAIGSYLRAHYYPLDKTLAQIRPDYRFDATCPGSVPQALLCFLESTDYEDTLRNAVSLGGDADTLAAIAGSIAWTYYARNGMGASMADIYRQAYPMLPAEFHRTARELAQLRRCPDDQQTTTEA